MPFTRFREAVHVQIPPHAPVRAGFRLVFPSSIWIIWLNFGTSLWLVGSIALPLGPTSGPLIAKFDRVHGSVAIFL
jgi:hypothetical protein